MSDAESKKDETPADHSPEEVIESPAVAETEADENGPVNVGSEDKDLDLVTVKKFIVVSFAVTIAVFILMLIVLRFFKTDFEADRGVATAETRQIPTKDDALLQTQPLMDLAEYNALEATRLNTTTNAIEHAVIPVEAAKQLMLQENAFPTPEKSAEVVHVETQVAESQVAEAVAEVAPVAPVASVPVVDAVPVVEEAPLDPAMVAAGKVIWETQCMAACHTGKKGAIATNIQKAFGTMRQLENHEPILMDTDYIINSLSNPMEHIAKGYPPVMMSFKETLSQEQKEQVAAYLQSQGKPIVKPTPVPVPTAVPAPVIAPTAVPAPVAPEPTAVPAPVIEQPAAPVVPEAPAPTPAPAPEKPAAPPGVIFV